MKAIARTSASSWSTRVTRCSGQNGFASTLASFPSLFTAETFSETVVTTHTPLSPVFLPPLDVELEGAGHFYSLEATLEGDPVQPSQPYTVTIEYTDGELGNIMEDTLGLYYWDGDSWELEPSAVVHPLTNTVVATPDHFSYWALLGEPYQIRFLPFVHK